MASQSGPMLGPVVHDVRALYRKVALPKRLWWAAVDSNHLPPRYQHGALPVELAAQNLASLVGRLILQSAEIGTGRLMWKPASRQRMDATGRLGSCRHCDHLDPVLRPGKRVGQKWNDPQQSKRQQVDEE